MSTTPGTTSRVTRARSKTPLPALSAKQSHAYGAKGKADLKAQVRPSGNTFNQAFEERAEDEEVEDEVEVAPSPTKKRGRPSRLSRQPSEPVVLEERVHASGASFQRTAPFQDRTATAMDAAAHYDHGVPHQDVNQDIATPEPPPARVFRRAAPRFIAEIFNKILTARVNPFWFAIMAFLTIYSIVTTFAWVPVPAVIAPARDRFVDATKLIFGIPTAGPITEAQDRWFRFQHDEIFSRLLPDYNVPDLQWAININFLQRLEKYEARLSMLEGDMRLQNDTIEKIHDLLPSHVIVKFEDGGWQIPEEFWEAMQERLTADNDEMAPLWRKYILRNEREIEHLNKQLVALHVAQVVQDQQILTRATFMDALTENNEYMAQKYHEEFRKLQLEHFEQVKDVARSTTHETIEESPAGMYAKDQVEIFAKLNQVHMAYEAIRNTNWFAIGLGARIDTRFTSPTKDPAAESWKLSLYRSFSPTAITPNQPMEALKHWNEVTDCWCSSLSDKGQSQLTVLLPKRIYPSKLVIEHIPHTGTPDIRAAPREVEIWADAGSSEYKATIKQAMRQYGPEWREQECGEPPADGFVCVGRGEYSIHKYVYVQTIGLYVNTEILGFGINRFTIRVVNNWGADHTCLYRVRMLGIDATVEPITAAGAEAAAGGEGF